MTRFLLLAALLAACGGATGTVKVKLITATGSHVLDAVQKLRLTITEPHKVMEVTRTSQGFALDLEVDSDTTPGALIVEGFDAGGALVACGQSPAFPLSAIDAAVAVFIAAPNSVTLSPVTLTTPRSEIAGTRLSFGTVIAGGRDASGKPTTDIGIYNAFDHTLAVGVPMPAARAGLAMATLNTSALLFGGVGADGTTQAGTLWQFDTTVAPNGTFATLSDQAGLARTGQLMLGVSNLGFLITGAPPLTFDGANLTARTDTSALPMATLPAVGGGGFSGAAVFIGGDAIIQFANSTFKSLGAGRANAAAATRTDGHVIVAGGGDPLTRDVLDINPDTGAIATVASALSVGRNRPSVTATSRHVVVVGGTDATGAVIASADVLDATTLTLIVTVPVEPRTGTYVTALPTDQVLIVGGATASGDLELFTPPPPTTP